VAGCEQPAQQVGRKGYNALNQVGQVDENAAPHVLTLALTVWKDQHPLPGT